jgi:electron transport complex protein RnfA
MMVYLAGLAVFSGFSLNILLQFGIGAAGIASGIKGKAETKRDIPFVQFGILFISILFLWFFLHRLLSVFWKGFYEVFLIFPFSALVCMGLELLVEQVISRVFSGLKSINKTYSAITAYEGLVPASIIIAFTAAKNAIDVLVMAVFFSAGTMLSMLILNEIRRRSLLEWVPKHLRGSPLIFISMGLLSMISASIAGICFKVLEIF